MVLLINFSDPGQLRKIQMILMMNKMRVRLVKKEEFLYTLGELASGADKDREVDAFTGELEREMMVFAGEDGGRIDSVIHAMKKNKVKPVDLKALLTATNRNWTVPQLYDEISKEHDLLNGGR